MRSSKWQVRGTWAGLVTYLLLVTCHLALGAQSRAAYEVTSVRANTTGPRGTQPRIAFTPGGDFTGINQPVRVILNFAYRLPLYRVEGMPDWFSSERFDISAKAPAGLNADADMRAQLLRSLLEDRFKLKARMVTREVPGMVLTMRRADGRLGPALRKSNGDCEAPDAAALARVQGREPSGRPPCSMGGDSAGPLCGTGVTMAQLVGGLGEIFQRPVVDKTGLAGSYDFLLTFTPDTRGGPGRSSGAAPSASVGFGGRPCTGAAGDAPSFATAMSEQLGLKLEAQRVPVEMLVIDSAERPTDN